jgi:hypothetical protein
MRRPEFCRLPCRRTKPSFDTPLRGPQIPSAELADHQAAAGSQHARHLAHGMLSVGHETEHRDRYYDIEACVGERQRADITLRERHGKAHCFGSCPGRRQHARIGVDTCHSSTAPGERCRERAIAAAGVEDAQPCG